LGYIHFARPPTTSASAPDKRGPKGKRLTFRGRRAGGGLTVRRTLPCLYRDKVNGKIGDEGVGSPATPGEEASPG